MPRRGRMRTTGRCNGFPEKSAGYFNPFPLKYFESLFRKTLPYYCTYNESKSMRPSVLFILLSAAMRTLASCSPTSFSSTSFSRPSGSTRPPPLMTTTATKTTTIITTTDDAGAGGAGDPEETDDPGCGGDECSGSGGVIPPPNPPPFPLIPPVLPVLPLGNLPLAGLPFVFDFSGAWNKSFTNASALVSYLVSLKRFSADF